MPLKTNFYVTLQQQQLGDVILDILRYLRFSEFKMILSNTKHLIFSLTLAHSTSNVQTERPKISTIYTLKCIYQISPPNIVHTK